MAIREHLEKRVKIKRTAEKDPDYRIYHLALCERDPVHFINHFCWTYDPRTKYPHIPFVLYPFQEELVKDLVNQIENGEDILIEKSRDMGGTWVVLAVGLWGWLFKGWDGRIGSRTENYVDMQGDMDSLFEKLRYMVEKMPQWMLPKGFEKEKHATYMRLINPHANCSIIGEAPTANFGTGGRRKWALLDEFAYWPHAESSWRKLGDTTPCRIAISTPEGRGNKFAKLRFSNDVNIKLVTLHWKIHPLKDEAWYEKEKKRRTPEEVAQELDISYDASVTGRVYPEFDHVEHGEGIEFDYDFDFPLFTAWDFGEGGPDPTVVLWLQIHPQTQQIRIIDVIEKQTGEMSWFAPFLRQPFMRPMGEYTEKHIEIITRHKNWKISQNWGDPYNANKTMLNTTISKELQRAGISMNPGKRTTVEERIRKTKLAMPRLKVHERCRDTFSQSIQNARYPQLSDNSQATNAKTKPIHDWTSHFRTALEYAIDNIPDTINRQRPLNLHISKLDF